MQNRKPHSQKDPHTGHSIFGTILFSLLAVLAVEFLLLTFAVHATRLGPQLNQNAEDILAMQVDNRSRYLQSIFHDAQELTSLSDAINGLTQQLLDEGEISLSTLDSSSDAAYPLLEAAAPELISTLRIKSVTGVFLILNTHDLDKRKQDSFMPAIYLRDLDPDAAPSQRNADLTFVRAPAQLVQSLSIATDNSWSPTIRMSPAGHPNSRVKYPRICPDGFPAMMGSPPVAAVMASRIPPMEGRSPPSPGISRSGWVAVNRAPRRINPQARRMSPMVSSSEKDISRNSGPSSVRTSPSRRQNSRKNSVPKTAARGCSSPESSRSRSAARWAAETTAPSGAGTPIRLKVPSISRGSRSAALVRNR